MRESCHGPYCTVLPHRVSASPRVRGPGLRVRYPDSLGDDTRAAPTVDAMNVQLAYGVADNYDSTLPFSGVRR